MEGDGACRPRGGPLHGRTPHAGRRDQGRTTSRLPAYHAPQSRHRKACRPGHREFVAEAPNQLWVADITYVRTFSGWVYAAVVIDVHSRMVLGWQLSRNLYTDLALDAVNMAIWQRTCAGMDLSGLVHHSDRGCRVNSIGRRNT